MASEWIEISSHQRRALRPRAYNGRCVDTKADDASADLGAFPDPRGEVPSPGAGAVSGRIVQPVARRARFHG